MSFLRSVAAEIPASWQSAKTSALYFGAVLTAYAAPFAGYGLHRLIGGAL